MAGKPIKKANKRGRDAKGRFVKGEYEGGPGRPRKATCISDRIRELLDIEAPNMGGKTYAELLAVAMVKEALAGNAPYMKELLERIEGKVQAPKTGPTEDTLNKVDQIFESLGYEA